MNDIAINMKSILNTHNEFNNLDIMNANGKRKVIIVLGTPKK